MPGFEEIKYRLVYGLIDAAGTFIGNQLTKTDYTDHEKSLEEYYTTKRALARDQEKKEQEDARRQQRQEEPPVVAIKDLTKEKIGEGSACLPCSRDHFSTTSSALSEALRFARSKGVRDKEVMNRLGIALDELNILERIDLAPENIVTLKGRERKLAEWGLDKSRDLRHKITAIQTPNNLESVAAEASRVRTGFMRDLWDLATADGTIDKLCKGLEKEEKERCISTINAVLKKEA